MCNNNKCKVSPRCTRHATNVIAVSHRGLKYKVRCKARQGKEMYIVIKYF